MGKGADRAVLDARFGGGESLRETLNALEQLGLVLRSDAGDVQLTDAGDRLAYAPDEAERRQSLVEALLGYWPYRVPLERVAGERLAVLDAPTVERIWQVDMRLGQPRNRVEEARTFFFRLADDAGLGSYRRGVRGQTTRLDLAQPAFGVLQSTLAALGEAEDQDAPAPVHTDQPDVAAPAPSEAPVPQALRLQPPSTSTPPDTTLSIQVDMSDWDLDKIEAFLSMIGYLDRT